MRKGMERDRVGVARVVRVMSAIARVRSVHGVSELVRGDARIEDGEGLTVEG